MLDAVGLPLERLARSRVGPIQLGDLRPGRHRYLNSAEVRSLYRSVDLGRAGDGGVERHGEGGGPAGRDHPGRRHARAGDRAHRRDARAAARAQRAGARRRRQPVLHRDRRHPLGVPRRRRARGRHQRRPDDLRPRARASRAAAASRCASASSRPSTPTAPAPSCATSTSTAPASCAATSPSDPTARCSSRIPGHLGLSHPHCECDHPSMHGHPHSECGWDGGQGAVQVSRDTVVVRAAGALGGTVRAPGSKSVTNRLLVLAALAEGESRLRGVLDSDDTRAMRDLIGALGATVRDDGADWVVQGTGGRLQVPEKPLECRLSGTTMRFGAALAALAPGPVTVDGLPPLRRRPIGALTAALTALGAGADDDSGFPPVVLAGGGLEGGPVIVDVSGSSQFASALLLVAPYARSPVTAAARGRVSQLATSTSPRPRWPRGASRRAGDGDALGGRRARRLSRTRCRGRRRRLGCRAPLRAGGGHRRPGDGHERGHRRRPARRGDPRRAGGVRRQRRARRRRRDGHGTAAAARRPHRDRGLRVPGPGHDRRRAGRAGRRLHDDHRCRGGPRPRDRPSARPGRGADQAGRARRRAPRRPHRPRRRRARARAPGDPRRPPPGHGVRRAGGARRRRGDRRPALRRQDLPRASGTTSRVSAASWNTGILAW